MALLRKRNSEWKPAESKELKVGETIEINDYRRLVEEGNADLVDAKGTVLPLPGTIFVCGICFDKIDSHESYVDHILLRHATEGKAPKEEKQAVVEPEEEEKIQVPEGFGEKMRKARAAARAKRAAAKTA